MSARPGSWTATIDCASNAGAMAERSAAHTFDARPEHLNATIGFAGCAAGLAAGGPCFVSLVPSDAGRPAAPTLARLVGAALVPRAGGVPPGASELTGAKAEDGDDGGGGLAVEPEPTA